MQQRLVEFENRAIGATGKEYVERVRGFQNLFNEAFGKDNRAASSMEFLSDYFKKAPLNRGVLKEFYHQLNSTGASNLAREIARVYAETTSSLLEIGMNSLGLPPIYEPNWAISRIGKIVDHTAYLKIRNQLDKVQLRPVLCLPKVAGNAQFPESYKLANSGFLPYLQDHFEIVTDIKESEYYYHNTAASPFDCTFFKYSESQYGHNKNFFSAVYKDILKERVPTPSFKLKDQTVSIAETFLKPFGIGANDDYILMYVKETDRSSEKQWESKLIEPSIFLDTINWFLKIGLKVVRIGHSKMTKFPSRTGLIDLTSIERPGEVDIYLCASAKFYLGSRSGPYSLANNFGVTCAIPALLPYGEQRAGDFNDFQKLEDKRTGRTLNMKEIADRGLANVNSIIAFQREGVVLRFPTSRNLLMFAKETLDYVEGCKVFQENKEKELELHQQGIYSGLSSSSLALLAC